MGLMDFLRSMSILSKLQRGDASGVDGLFRLYADGLFHYALTLVRDSHAAEDVVQEVFTELVLHSERLANVLNLKSYLFQAVRNRALNTRQRILREQPASESEHLFEGAASCRFWFSSRCCPLRQTACSSLESGPGFSN